MKNILNGAEESQTTGLEHLSDEELLTYKHMVEDLSTRELDTLQHSVDTKFSYHVVRLVLQCEQILVEQDLDLERSRELLKAIRRGEWTEQRLRDWFSEKETHLESLYTSSTLRHSPDEDALKNLLLDCLEQHYGSLEKAVVRQGALERLVQELEHTIQRYK